MIASIERESVRVKIGKRSRGRGVLEIFVSNLVQRPEKSGTGTRLFYTDGG